MRELRTSLGWPMDNRGDLIIRDQQKLVEAAGMDMEGDVPSMIDNRRISFIQVYRMITPQRRRRSGFGFGFFGVLGLLIWLLIALVLLNGCAAFDTCPAQLDAATCNYLRVLL